MSTTPILSTKLLYKSQNQTTIFFNKESKVFSFKWWEIKKMTRINHLNFPFNVAEAAFTRLGISTLLGF